MEIALRSIEEDLGKFGDRSGYGGGREGRGWRTWTGQPGGGGVSMEVIMTSMEEEITEMEITVISEIITRNFLTMVP